MSSYFWDRATDAGIITDETAITWELRPSDMKAAGERACSTPLAQLTTAFPKVWMKALLRFVVAGGSIYATARADVRVKLGASYKIPSVTLMQDLQSQRLGKTQVFKQEYVALKASLLFPPLFCRAI